MCLFDLKMRRVESVSRISDFPDSGQDISDELITRSGTSGLQDIKTLEYFIQCPT